MPKFEKGRSGNPRGRPQGSVNHKKFKEAILDNAPRIIESMIEKATAGDTAAAKLLLDRVFAPMKPGDSMVDMPLTGNLSDDARRVVMAIGAQQISAGQGQIILSGMASMARIVEIDELIERVEKLEARHVERQA